MERVDALCAKMEVLSRVQPGERVEFDQDGSVHLTRGWRRWANRKALNMRGQSRHSTYKGILTLFDLSNDISSGLLRMPKIRVDCLRIGANDRANVDGDGDDDDDDIDDASSDNEDASMTTHFAGDVEETAAVQQTQDRFFDECDDRVRAGLRRLSTCLKEDCCAINTLNTSTYVDDKDMCGALMKLINYGSLQRERIDAALSRMERVTTAPVMKATTSSAGGSGNPTTTTTTTTTTAELTTTAFADTSGSVST